MKAITIRQPRAQLIIDGRKDIENRTWSTRYQGEILIHAAAESHGDVKTMADCEFWMAKKGLGRPPAIKPAQRGAVLGVARLVDCVSASASPWFIGPHGLVLVDVLKFETPVPMKGSLSLWEPAEAQRRAVESAISMAVFERGRQARIAAGKETACRGCGCSESRACPGGCAWLSAGWCTACQERSELMAMRQELWSRKKA